FGSRPLSRGASGVPASPGPPSESLPHAGSAPAYANARATRAPPATVVAPRMWNLVRPRGIVVDVRIVALAPGHSPARRRSQGFWRCDGLARASRSRRHAKRQGFCSSSRFGSPGVSDEGATTWWPGAFFFGAVAFGAFFGIDFAEASLVGGFLSP